MRISLYTQISPRLETFFLEEWIEHHLMIGVDKIHLYNNGFLSVDRRYGRGKVWGKKPYANYFLEYTDAEIMNKLQTMVESFGNSVSLVPWTTGVECGEPHRAQCQRVGYKHCVENNQSDWWIHIDPDEYILSKKYLDLKEFISAQDTEKYGAFTLGQKLFGIRTTSQSVRSITECDWDVASMDEVGLTKTIICDAIVTFDIHQPILNPKCGTSKLVEFGDLMYYHYRGHFEPTMSRDEFENYKLLKHDDSMIQFLKKHGVTL